MDSALDTRTSTSSIEQLCIMTFTTMPAMTPTTLSDSNPSLSPASFGVYSVQFGLLWHLNLSRVEVTRTKPFAADVPYP